MIVKLIPDLKYRRWMTAFYNYAFENESELEMIRARVGAKEWNPKRQKK